MCDSLGKKGRVIGIYNCHYYQNVTQIVFLAFLLVFLAIILLCNYIDLQNKLTNVRLGLGYISAVKIISIVM